MPSFLLHPAFMTIDRLAAMWADAQVHLKNGDAGPLQNFINSQLAEAWKEMAKETAASALTSHIGTYKPGVVPAGVQMLTAGIDIQLDHIWVSLLGWGYMSEVWSIYEARLQTGDTNDLANYELLEKFLAMTWPLAAEKTKTMGIFKAAIDCAYPHPDVVFDFCRSCSGLVDIIPVRGDDSVKTRVYRAVKLPDKVIVRYDLNVNVIKDRLYWLLYESKTPGRGWFHLHSETSPEVLAHLAGEEQRKIRNRRKTETIWVKKEGEENHIWDCDVYATFAAEIAGARLLRDPDAPAPKVTRRVGQIERMRR